MYGYGHDILTTNIRGPAMGACPGSMHEGVDAMELSGSNDHAPVAGDEDDLLEDEYSDEDDDDADDDGYGGWTAGSSR